MNPAYECPLDTPLDEMRERMKEYRRPMMLVSKSGVLLARNKLAEYKTFKVRLGCSANKLFRGNIERRYSGMSPGEMRHVLLKTEKPQNGAIVRFQDYFLIFCLSAYKELVQSVLELIKANRKGASGVLDYCLSLDENVRDDMARMKQMMAEQMRREMNLGKTLEILVGAGEDVVTFFSPFLLAKEACNMAKESVGEDNQVLATRLSPTELHCRGVSEEYASALAAMIVFAVTHSKSGSVQIEGNATDRFYKFSTRFVSDLTRREIEKLLYGSLKSNSAKEIFAKADLMYICCIAEDALWDLDLVDERLVGEAGEGGKIAGEAGENEKSDKEGEKAAGESKKPIDRGRSRDITLRLSVPLLSGGYFEFKRPTAVPEIFSALRTQLVPLRRKREQQ